MVNWDSREIPETIYKYRDWKNGNHKKNLTNQEIFFSSPRLFNDPFDCRLQIAYYKLKEDENLAKDYFSIFVERQLPHLTKHQKEIEVQRLISEGRFKDDEYIYEANQKSIEQLHDIYGVLSLTAVKDNILMWAHYSNDHHGFCVGFDSIKLFEYFGGGGGKINYEDNYPIILPTDDLIVQMAKQTHTKASFWDYEIEYRLSKMNFSNKAISIPAEFITELILGYKISESDESEIVDIISTKLPHVNILKTKPRKLEFEFDLVEIK